MKKILLIGILLLPASVMAQVSVCDSTFTVQNVTVSTYTGTQVDTTARRMNDRKWVEVQNISTNTVHCMQSSAVTTSTGRLLAANGGSWAINLKGDKYTVAIATYPTAITRTLVPISFYCIGSGDTLGSVVTLSQCK